MRASRAVVVATLTTVMGAVSHGQGMGSMSVAACLSADSLGARSRVFAIASQCSPVWSDSLSSKVVVTRQVARGALWIIGGRSAVDALHARFRSSGDPLDRFATIYAMSTTVSPDDVGFLIEQLKLPDDGESWPFIQAAATVLGLHRVESAREALAAVVARTRPGRFTSRAASHALESLDRPPCADSAGANLGRELVRIVMECTPPFLSIQSRYQDESTGNVWAYSPRIWRERARLASDTVAGTITTSILLVPGSDDAMVQVGMRCGGLCGEGWSYRLRRIGRVWRVIGAEFNWVS